MQKLNFTQIKDILESQLFRDYDHEPQMWFGENVFEPSETEFKVYGISYTKNASPEFHEQFRKLGEFQMVEQFGGEGDGDKYWTVYHFKDHDVFIMFHGWYQSYHGSEYSDMYEVKPVQVTRTEYQTV